MLAKTARRPGIGRTQRNNGWVRKGGMVALKVVGIERGGMGRHSMVLTVARACVIGDFGAIVRITWHLDAHGGAPREKIGARHSGNAVRPRQERHPRLPNPQFRRKFRFHPRRRSICIARRPRVIANSPSRPPRMRGGVGRGRYGQFGLLSLAPAP